MSEIDNTIDYEEESQEYPYKTAEAKDIDKSVLEKLFSTDKRIEHLYRSLRGEYQDGEGNWYKGSYELCGKEFATKQIIAFSQVVNPMNSFSKKSSNECKRILHDAVEAFIGDCYLELTVKDEDVITLSKMYEHALELFLGLVEFGHGAKVLTAALSGQTFDIGKTEEKKQGFLGWLGK